MAGVEMPDKKQPVITNNFPSNSKDKSKVTKPTETERPRMESIVKAGVKKRKTPLGKKFARAMFNEETKNIKNYVIHDIIIPGAKNVVYDIVVNSLGMTLFGQIMPSNLKRHNGISSPITNYNARSTVVNGGRTNRASQSNVRQISDHARRNHDYAEITFLQRQEAEAVLDRMIDYLDNYGIVRVSDLYDLIGATSNYADKKYGWTNLGGSTVERTRDGYELRLPQTEPI